LHSNIHNKVSGASHNTNSRQHSRRSNNMDSLTASFQLMFVLTDSFASFGALASYTDDDAELAQ